MPEIVVLDGAIINPGDLSWDRLASLGQLTVYPESPPELVLERSKGAAILLTNKAIVNAETIHALDKLRYIGVIASGYNTVDVEAAAARNIPVTNGTGYGTNSVAQHVWAMILHFSNQLDYHNRDVQAGGWTRSGNWSYWKRDLHELAGSTLGIVGFGKIGQQVAQIAQAFGMKILAHHKHPLRNEDPNIEAASLDRIFRESDFLSLHVPLNDETEGLIRSGNLKKMKKSSYLINTGRGGLVVEEDLRIALSQKIIAGAALDVLSQEPPPSDHPLLGLDNCLITPHIAWASKAARSRLLDIVADNVESFLKGEPKNVVNGV